MFAIHKQIVSDVLFIVPPPHFFVPSGCLEKRTVCKNISFTPKHSNSRLIPKWSKVYSTIQAPGITMIQKRSKVVWAASAFSAASRQGRRADRAQTSRLRPRCQRQQPLGRAGRQWEYFQKYNQEYLKIFYQEYIRKYNQEYFKIYYQEYFQKYHLEE